MTEQQPPSMPEGSAAPQPTPAQSSALEPYAPQPYASQPYASQPYGPDGRQPYAHPYGMPGQAPLAQGYAPMAFSPVAGPAPYGVDPVTGAPWSHKTRATAGLLQLLLPFVGVCGVGRLYAGQIGIGLAQLLGFFFGGILTVALVGFVIAPAVWLWAVIDGIVLLSAGGRDQYGRPLR